MGDGISATVRVLALIARPRPFIRFSLVPLFRRMYSGHGFSLSFHFPGVAAFLSTRFAPFACLYRWRTGQGVFYAYLSCGELAKTALGMNPLNRFGPLLPRCLCGAAPPRFASVSACLPLRWCCAVLLRIVCRLCSLS